MGNSQSSQSRAERLLELQRDMGRVLNTIKDLRTSLEYLLEVATKVEGVDSGGVYIADPRTGSLDLAAHRGVSAEFVQVAQHVGPDHPVAHIIRQGKAMYGPPVPVDPDVIESCEMEGLRGSAVIPLQHEGQIVGALCLSSHSRTQIPDQSRIVIEAIATQAQGTIARIQAEEAHRQVEARLRTIIANAPLVLFAVDQQGIITFEEGRALREIGNAGGQNVGLHYTQAQPYSPVVQDLNRRALEGEELNTVVELGGRFLDVRFCPVRDESGAPGGHIGVATDVTERMQLEQKLLEISDREQARIGQDIHDGLCQKLVSAAFDANSLVRQMVGRGTAERVLAERIAKLLDEAITESRQVARGLYPVKLEAEGLRSALEELAVSTSHRFGGRCEVVNPERITVLNNVVATHVYRIVQEAINNAVKHSGTDHIVIELRVGDGHLWVEVRDRGRGLPANARANDGMGLAIMEYRARMIGGRLTVAAASGGGTVVSCCVPLEKL